MLRWATEDLLEPTTSERSERSARTDRGDAALLIFHQNPSRHLMCFVTLKSDLQSMSALPM